MKIVAALAVLVLAGCSSSLGAPAATAPPSTSQPAPSSSAAPSAFGLVGTLTLYGAISTGVDSMAPGSTCLGIRGDLSTEDYEDITVDTQVMALDGAGATVGLGSITSSSMDVVNPPDARQCTFHFVVSGIKAGLGFYSLKIGSQETPQQSEADFRAGPSFSIKSALYSG